MKDNSFNNMLIDGLVRGLAIEELLVEKGIITVEEFNSKKNKIYEKLIDAVNSKIDNFKN